MNPGTYRAKIRAAHDMELTVADWLKIARRWPTRYGWALPYIQDKDPSDLVAPILASALKAELP